MILLMPLSYNVNLRIFEFTYSFKDIVIKTTVFPNFRDRMLLSGRIPRFMFLLERANENSSYGYRIYNFRG